MGATAAAGQRARHATRNLGSRAQAGADQVRHHEIMRLHRQVRDLTMVPRRAFIDNVLLARRGAAAGGDLVECGTWRGGLSAAMAWALPGRHSVLFDSFEGLPDAKPIDGPDAIRYSTQERGYDNCRAEEAWAAQAMARVGQPDAEIIKGWFEDTVPVWAQQQRPIAVLRLDGDWYDSTILCLEHLWPLVSQGGIVIIDDYYTWDGCSKAVHDHLSRAQAAERIECSPRGVAYLVRRERPPGR
jgi:O-methyltransferase